MEGYISLFVKAVFIENLALSFFLRFPRKFPQRWV
jgi:Na+-transporting NADH:ubiquinone oxidoreductase subunit NqrE